MENQLPFSSVFHCNSIDQILNSISYSFNSEIIQNISGSLCLRLGHHQFNASDGIG